jgi:hypothetical protein
MQISDDIKELIAIVNNSDSLQEIWRKSDQYQQLQRSELEGFELFLEELRQRVLWCENNRDLIKQKVTN